MLTHLIQSSGYLAIFALMTLESMLLPIPSEVVMPFGGYLASQGVLNLWGVIAMGAAGNLAGSLAAYYIGHLLEESVLVGWIRRYGKYLFIRERDYHRGVAWFAKYGSPAVFFSRMLPVVRTFLSLPAGMFEMRLGRFSLYTFVGSLLWSGFLTWIGYLLGAQWERVGGLLKPLEYAVIGGVVFGAAYFVYRRILRNQRA